MMLEPVEHRPSIHAGHVDVEGDRVGFVGVGELEPRFAVKRIEALEALLARHLEQNLREVEIVLDDEQHPIARHESVAIVVEPIGAR